jgi:hypothetical protein
MDKSDELRLLPLSVSWYHADVVRAINPLLDESVPVDVVCASLSAVQLRKYATAADTASGIAKFVLNRVGNSADAKSALANVTNIVQQIHEVLNNSCQALSVSWFRMLFLRYQYLIASIACRRAAQVAACPCSNFAIHVSRGCPVRVSAQSMRIL